MQNQPIQVVAREILALKDVEVADFIRDEVIHKRLSHKLCLLNEGARAADDDSRRMARQAIERLGFL